MTNLTHFIQGQTLHEGGGVGLGWLQESPTSFIQIYMGTGASRTECTLNAVDAIKLAKALLKMASSVQAKSNILVG